MVGSAVVEETLKQALSSLIGNQEAEEYDEKEQHVERLEMAQLRLEAAVDASRKWHIHDASLLRWRRKLRRVAEECGEFKRRAVVEHEEEDQATTFSFFRRLARAATSLFVSGGHDASAAVRRFEWLADSAGEFLRFVELGGTPRRCAVRVDPLIGRLLAGEELRYRVVRRSRYHLLCVRPISLDERGVEAKLLFVYEDDEAPEENLCLGSIMRISESTDVIGTVARCLELLATPHFRPTAESARRELAQLPRQDFSWVPYLESGDKEHWNAMHSSLTQWFRPNPLCCSKHVAEKRPTASSSSSSGMKLSDVSTLEPTVIEVFLQRHVPLSEYNVNRRAVDNMHVPCLKDVPHLKLGLLFSPHGSSEEMTTLAPAAAESAAVEVIDGEEQRGGVHRNVSLEQLDEFMLPKAIDCLHRKPEAAAYQMFWKSTHGTAFLHVERTTGLTKAPPRYVDVAGGSGSRRAMIRQRRDPKLERWIQVVIDFLNLWGAHAPRRLQGSIVDWVRKANEMQQEARPMGRRTLV
ncbi:hypothetical protein PR202_ga13205 [Eleusine coracana subsp. coracana]|uniref:Uncharacterized protein n=1 Tax=Eleusine coracana subsp. coracana TaxID=191504 RepID=A0AAV5CDN4_ELECO|nr:hypothetical protein PR202_ga13205 [Eleusine coracana subsp. coracana]